MSSVALVTFVGLLNVFNICLIEDMFQGTHQKHSHEEYP